MRIKKRPLMTRREFLAGVSGTVAGATLTGTVPPALQKLWTNIPGEILGANAKVGHLLREGQFPPTSETLHTELLIVGGGVAGLSAGWWLKKKKQSDFILLELEDDVGGNSRSGKNSVSAYPWGAHYVPLPTLENKLVLELFEELGVIEGWDIAGLPIYNEFFLSNDPQERVFASGQWQEGLIPKTELTAEDQNQFAEFFKKMDQFRGARGSDGKKLFSIPIDESSQDPAVLRWDLITMAQFLAQHRWDSPRLHWYINYCCRDDYGAELTQVSAWAGIHYFAARGGKGSNSSKGNVLTWPEGNAWLTEKLKSSFTGQIRTSSLVYQICADITANTTANFDAHSKADTDSSGTGYLVDYYDVRTQKSIRIVAKTLIYAAPRFTAPFVFETLRKTPPTYLSSLEYSPWMVANITTRTPSTVPKEAPLSWDNIIYESPSLGYVNAGNQKIERYPVQTVLTYYHPLSHLGPKQARHEALGKTHSEWTTEILADLRAPHPDLVNQLRRIDVWLWGHGMVRPQVGFIWGEHRQEMLKPLGGVFFAHSDMSGISIFEEAQYRGVQAAKQALLHLGKS
jgi:hypothetical protein